MSTILFDTIWYLKEIWIFETKFIFGNYLIEKKIAKKIRLDYLEEDIEKVFVGRRDKKLIDSIFSPEDLKDVLKRELL